MGSVAEEESFPASDPDNPGTPVKSLKEESSYTLAEEQSMSMSQEDVMEETQGSNIRSVVSPTKSNLASNDNSRRYMTEAGVRLYTQFGTRGGAFSMAKPKSDVDIKIKVLLQMLSWNVKAQIEFD
jgi:hypothetical protein